MKTAGDKAAFKNRVRHWAEKLDVKIAWLGVQPMRNKWASCSTAGYLNFNDGLLQMDRQLWDYVIVHELLHFFVPNHGKLWKSLMRAHLGDWEVVADPNTCLYFGRQVFRASSTGCRFEIDHRHIAHKTLFFRRRLQQVETGAIGQTSMTVFYSRLREGLSDLHTPTA